MRKLLIAILALAFANCSGQKDNAIEQAKATKEVLKENSPGYVATSAEGYYMKAIIDGKEWVATSMMPPEEPSRIIGEKNGESISLPYDRRDMVVGKKRNFETYAVDLLLNDDVAIWGGHKGEMVITKIDDKSAEGNFYFTASSDNTTKTIQVTDGFFRIIFK
ncbi:MAG: hypothetical protein ABIT96_10110 [Ferruginibacter sp.]